jgi:hypothetical protein
MPYRVWLRCSSADGFADAGTGNFLCLRSTHQLQSRRPAYRAISALGRRVSAIAPRRAEGHAGLFESLLRRESIRRKSVRKGKTGSGTCRATIFTRNCAN